MKKITQERFDADPAKVIDYVRKSDRTVIVYNEEGPVALLSPKRARRSLAAAPRAPRTARTIPAVPALPDDAALDEGGVWRLDDETRAELKKPRWRRKLEKLSPAGLLKIASALPFLAAVKS